MTVTEVPANTLNKGSVYRILSVTSLVLMLLVYSCSTEKNAPINRGYHNMTARYNGYFNAGEIIKESMRSFREGYQDDYTRILPVYVYADEKSASSLYPEMDRAITKTSVVIKKHSMPNPEKSKNKKKEEWCKWIDNNWLLMGQAHFYKREFAAAREKFEYMLGSYKKDEIKFDAQLWLARTFMEDNNMMEAQRYLERLQGAMEDAEEEKKGDKKATSKKTSSKKSKKKKSSSKKKKKEEEPDPVFPDRLKKDLFITQADYHIRKKEFEKAIEKLEAGIKITKKKRERARYTFILAQLYQQRGNNTAAFDAYAKIPKLNPTYEMEFYSRINRALMFQGGDSRGLRAELLKMLKDEKNKDYFDQIYYALAEIELKQNKTEQGKDYLNKSIAASVSNDRQKGKSYLRLGDLNFTDRNYVEAKSYYDSSLTFLPKDYSGIDVIEKRSESLKDLVEHLRTYRLQDSLLKVSQMSRREQEKLVENVIQKQEEEEARRKEAELAKQNATVQPTNNMVQTGGWYFYNQQAMALGFNEFKKVWGQRKLEDDWRRSNKTSIAEMELGNDSLVVEDPDEKREKLKEEMLDKIPRGPEQILACQDKIQTALYESGVIFKDKLSQNDLAIKNFKELVTRFEEGDLVLPAHYQLFLLLGSPGGEPHKNVILTDFPESEYAELIRNPNYKKEASMVREQQEAAYSSTLALYLKKDYSGALEQCNNVLQNEPKNLLAHRYRFMKALCLGELKRMEEFEAALSECAEKHPTEETGKQAKELLNFIRNKESLEAAKEGTSKYVFDANTEHYFVLVFPGSMGSIMDAKARFSDFNNKFFVGKGYKVTNNFLDTDNQLILIKQFAGKEIGMQYYRAFAEEKETMTSYQNGVFFLISSRNYSSFFLDKNIEEYKTFFQENYLK